MQKIEQSKQYFEYKDSPGCHDTMPSWILNVADARKQYLTEWTMFVLLHYLTHTKCKTLRVVFVVTCVNSHTQLPVHVRLAFFLECFITSSPSSSQSFPLSQPLSKKVEEMSIKKFIVIMNSICKSHLIRLIPALYLLFY